MDLTRRSILQLDWLQPATTAVSDPTHHLLNRLSYGPRPEEIAYARDTGIEAYLDEQLNPETIADPECDRRLEKLPLLFMDRDTLYGMQDGEYRSQRALTEGFLTRAVYSRRQLLERVTEFWSDHFNVFGEEWSVDALIYQRDAIRRHALGRFRNLLLATAKSPAMLYYLDNYVNIAGDPNENYARELLELHTMGVDGGYTETDVKEVARAFTGWTVHNGTRTGFYFDPEAHDTEQKTILGHRLPAGRGIEDGLHVLSILALHPATAQYVSRKLAVRFVSDDPPDTLVAGMAQVWQQSGGDIRAVLRHLFLAAEFTAAAGQKLRRPLDFMVGVLRATDTTVSDHWLLHEMMLELGQPPYGWPAPDGYPDTAAAWLSTGGLLARWNVAMRLTHAADADPWNGGWGLSASLGQRVGAATTVGDLVDAVATQVFGLPLTGPARTEFVKYAADGGGSATAVTTRRRGRKLASLFGLMLASPYFQWR